MCTGIKVLHLSCFECDDFDFSKTVSFTSLSLSDIAYEKLLNVHSMQAA